MGSILGKDHYQYSTEHRCFQSAYSMIEFFGLKEYTETGVITSFNKPLIRFDTSSEITLQKENEKYILWINKLLVPKFEILIRICDEWVWLDPSALNSPVPVPRLKKSGRYTGECWIMLRDRFVYDGKSFTREFQAVPLVIETIM